MFYDILYNLFTAHFSHMQPFKKMTYILKGKEILFSKIPPRWPPSLSGRALGPVSDQSPLSLSLRTGAEVP